MLLLADRMSTKGRPLQIIKDAGDGFELNETDLERILENDELRDRFVVVISVAGAFRKGKSFLLGFFIRFLEALVSDFLFTFL